MPSGMRKYHGCYKRKDSPFWWIQFYSERDLKRHARATEFRLDRPGDHRKAMDLARELANKAILIKSESSPSRWDRWVSDYLKLRYRGPDRAKSLTRMLSAWRQWEGFLNERNILTPQGLSYTDALDFITWRSSQVKRASGKVVSKNTAIIDSKCMSVILGEAQRRGWVTGIVTHAMGISKDRPEEKPELTDEDIKQIRTALKKEPEWMQVAFEIAIHQGCRQRETCLPLSRVDLRAGTIQFHAKGRDGAPRVFTTRLHPGLKPLIERIVASGRKTTCDMPKLAGKDFHLFFHKRLKRPDLCFHCTRVTVVTRLARSGVSEQQAMAYVGHASTFIHKIYQRLKAKDTGPAVDALAGI